MHNLEEYFRVQYPVDRNELDFIEKKVLFDAFKIFGYKEYFFDKTWPYELIDGKKIEEPNKFSFSTASMILFMMATVLGTIQDSVLLPTSQQKTKLQSQATNDNDFAQPYKDRMLEGFASVVRESNNVFQGQPKRVFNSSSFGMNDPFTLTWFVELISCLDQSDTLREKVEKKIGKSSYEQFKSKLRSCSNVVVREAFRSIKQTNEKTGESFLKWEGTTGGRPHKTPIMHAFPYLRAIHLYKTLNKTKSTKISPQSMRDYFLSGIHQHLSFYNIEDSAYDTAELVFFFEGYLLLEQNKRSVEKHLIDRFFHVIDESQKRSTYWRPLKPFVTEPTGLALLPLSVEISNSLIRILRLLGEINTDYYITNYIHLFRKYSDWLLTRIARGKMKNKNRKSLQEFCGWHSEHINVPDRIHPWETSQVILYLMHYSSLLQDYIAKIVLKKSNLPITPNSRESTEIPSKYWTNNSKLQESLNGLDTTSPLNIKKRICHHYLEPRDDKHCALSETKPHYSMLLYGPPGTGKTFIVSELAKALQWPLITITPSNFIAEGEAEVEARAKTIFETLEQQNKVVVLFDEIDRLILDRDSRYYQNQSDIFQFMTPGMLVKFKNLREKENVIFAIATNYEERIDAAIKRTGRIDDKFLIVPPDFSRRKQIIIDTLQTVFKTNKSPKYENTVKRLRNDRKFRDVVKATALGNFKELGQLVLSTVESCNLSKAIQISDFVEKLDDIRKKQEKPSVRLSMYKRRFKIHPENADPELKQKIDDEFMQVQEPFTEFLVLTYLKTEYGNEPDEEDLELVKQVFQRLAGKDWEKIKKNKNLKQMRSALKEKVGDAKIVNSIITNLNNYIF